MSKFLELSLYISNRNSLVLMSQFSYRRRWKCMDNNHSQDTGKRVISTESSLNESSGPDSEEEGRSCSGQAQTGSSKYKTELCKNYSEKGYCPYRWKCQFAHGQEELHIGAIPLVNKKFRTKKCRSYWQQGFCPYGVRCQFYHDKGLRSETV